MTEKKMGSVEAQMVAWFMIIGAVAFVLWMIWVGWDWRVFLTMWIWDGFTLGACMRAWPELWIEEV